MRISLDLIEPGTRLRAVTTEQVMAIAESMKEVGLLSPITVYARDVIRAGIAVRGYGLIAGLHRLEAARGLGWDEIEAQVVELPELSRQLAECDENLCGTKLTQTERALFTRRRKEIYEAIHPETRHGVNQHTSSRQVGETSRFTADTASRTGRSERDVQRDATRGERIAEDVLSSIAGTDLDKGVVLDALAATPRDQQQEKVAELQRRKEARKAVKKAGDEIAIHDSEAVIADILLANITADEIDILLSHFGVLGMKGLSRAVRRAQMDRHGPRERDVPVFDRTRAGAA